MDRNNLGSNGDMYNIRTECVGTLRSEFQMLCFSADIPNVEFVRCSQVKPETTEERNSAYTVVNNINDLRRIFGHVSVFSL